MSVRAGGRVEKADFRCDSNNERSSIPITVRQLEAIIRISESLAKVTLNTQVTEHHVDEAMRLFKVSSVHAFSLAVAYNVRSSPRWTLYKLAT